MGGEFPINTAPIATAATNITQTGFTANWNLYHFASKYKIDIYTMVDNQKVYVSGYQNKDVGNVISYTVDGLNSETTYYYLIRATDGISTTINSNEIALTNLAYTLDLFKPIALDATNITNNSFVARWTWNTNYVLPQSYNLTVYEKKIGAEIGYTSFGFNGSVFPTGWTTSNTSFYTSSGYYRSASPSAYLTVDGSYLETNVFERKIRSIQFWYRGRSTGATNSLLIYCSLDGAQWQLIKTINPLITAEGQTIVVAEAEIPDCNALKFVYSKPGIGFLAVDDVKIGLQEISNTALTDYNAINVGNVNEYQVVGLNKISKYYYTVVAKNLDVLSAKSNEISTETLADGTFTGLQNLKNPYSINIVGNELLISSDSKYTSLSIYNLSGQKMLDTFFDESIRINKEQLPTGIYILKINNGIHKLLW